jgi:hypothetical protein
MSILLVIYFVFIFVWLLGVSAAAYHVFKYRLPGDHVLTAFWIFLAASALTLLIIAYIVSGANWEAF